MDSSIRFGIYKPKRAQARPAAIEAHAGLVRAIMMADDLLVSGPYPLNLALGSLGALEQLGAALDNAPAFTSLFRGLLARDSGDTPAAEAALQQALAYDPQLTLAWRALAVIALAQGSITACVAACQSGLTTAPHDEPILTLLMGAYLRGNQRNQAADVAGQIAQNRGGTWTAEAVLREIGF
jgi:DNA-binding SARP family transcriptional activator